MGFGGISRKYIYYEFELDSLDYSFPSNSSTSGTDWPVFLIGGKRPLQNIAAIKVLEAQIPFSWYVFNSENNTFEFTEVGGTVTITIPEGNYTTTQMATLLSTLLTTASPGTHTYTVTADAPTQKFHFVNDDTVNHTFSFTFGVSSDPGQDNPRLWLGFSGGTTASNFVGGVNTLIAPNAYQITGPNYLYVNSRRLGNLTSLYLPEGATNLGNGNAGPQIAKIPINVQPGGVIFWQDPDPQKWFNLENLPSLSELDLFITAGNTSNVLKFNGQGFSLKLGILEIDFSQTFFSSGTVDESHVVKRIRRS